jgi:glycine/D-amino acid oxidase-like deaminating enzyme
MPKQTKVNSRKKRAAPEVVVIGAGLFGAWTALHLADVGARVTLVDALGPGHLRGPEEGS